MNKTNYIRILIWFSRIYFDRHQLQCTMKENGAPSYPDVVFFLSSGEQIVHFTLANLVPCILTCQKMASNERLQLNAVDSLDKHTNGVIGWVVFGHLFWVRSIFHIQMSARCHVTVIKIMFARIRRDLDFILSTEINRSKAFVNSFIAPNQSALQYTHV